MTGIQACLDRLGWSRKFAADKVGCTESQMRRWADGRSSRGNEIEAPGHVLAYLARCRDAIDRVPKPPRR